MEMQQGVDAEASEIAVPDLDEAGPILPDRILDNSMRARRFGRVGDATIINSGLSFENIL